MLVAGMQARNVVAAVPRDTVLHETPVGQAWLVSVSLQ